MTYVGIKYEKIIKIYWHVTKNLAYLVTKYKVKVLSHSSKVGKPSYARRLIDV